MKRTLRWLAIGIGGLLAVVALLVAGAILFLRTDTGAGWLAATLEDSLSTPEQKIHIDGLSGALPFEWRVKQMEVADRNGVWLRVGDAAVDIDAGALFGGTARVDLLSAGSIEVLRAPAPSQTPGPPPTPWKSFSLPRLPLAIELGKLSVPRIALAAGVAGDAATLSAEGEASLHLGIGHVGLRVVRSDGSGRVDLRADYGPPPAGGAEQLDLALHIAEPTGSLLEPLSPTHEKLPAHLDLAGKGPLAAWQGTLDAAAGPDATLAATLTISRHDTDFSLAAKGSLHGAALLDETLKPAIGNDLAFDIGATAADAGPLGLDRARISLALGTVSAQGRYDPKGNAVTAKLDAEADLAPASALAGQTLAGSIKLGATLSGTLDQPVAVLDLTGSKLAAGTDTLDSLTTHVDVNPLADGRLHVTSTGKLAGLAANGQAPAAGLGDEIDYALDLAADKTGQAIDLAKATATGSGLAIDASGKLVNGIVSGNATLKAADLSRFAALAGSALAGDAAIKITATSPDGKSVSAKIDGTLNRFRLGVPEADAALGPAVSFAATADRDAAGRLSLGQLKLTGADLSVAGNGAYDPVKGTINGHATLALPDLKPIGTAAGSPLTGALTVTADATGNAATVKLDGNVQGAGGLKLDRLEATLGIDDLRQKAVRVSAALTSGQTTTTIDLKAAQPAQDRIVVDGLSVKGPGTTVTGGVTLTLGRAVPLAAGTIDAHVADLAAWGPLVGETLGGKVDLALKLTDTSGQGANATLDGKALAFGPGPSAMSLKSLHLTTDLGDLTGRPHGTADLTLTGGKAPGAALDQLTLKAKPAAAGAFDVAINGTGLAQGKRFTLATDATVTADAARQSVTVNKLDGAFADVSFRLQRALKAARAGAVLTLDDLSLGLGSGHIDGSARYDGKTVQAALKAADLSVDTLSKAAGRDDVAGKLGFDLSLAGSVTAPTGHAVLTLSQLKLGEGDRSEIPALEFSVSGDITGSAVDFKGRFDGEKGEAALGFSGTVPVAFAPGGAVSLPPDGMLRGKLEGDGRLETLSQIVPIGEDKMGGRYTIDLSLGGTIRAPLAGGRLSLTGGSYDNSNTGMTLRGLEVVVSGNGQQFTLDKLAANDGGSGTLSAGGKVDLAAAGGPSFDLTAKLKSFAGARSDLISAMVSGDARVSGNVAAPQVKANLSIDSANVNIPQQMPPSIVVLNVVRYDSRMPRAEQEAARRAAIEPPPPVVATLDVAIHDAGQTFVRGDGLDSEWKGDLAVKGTSAAPAVVGQLSSVSGTFSILGKDFTLQQGFVYFTGSTTPSFDIQAQAQTTDITATVEIQGTPDRPKLTLSSVPSLPQDEILSQVMFGSGTSQLSPAQGLQLAQAAATLAGGGGPGVLDRLRNVTGLDRLTVGQDQTQQQQGGGGVSSGTTISGGKYVRPGVYVGVDQGLGGSTRARVEVNVTSHVTVNAIAGSGGNTGSSLGVQYQLDY